MVNFEATITVPVALLVTMASLIALPIVSIFRGWIVPGVFFRREIARGDAERQAKDDALEANKLLTEANNLLLRKDDLGLTALTEIRDYIRRHDPPANGGDHP